MCLDFWRMESIGSNKVDPSVSVEDKSALAILESTTKLVNGRYEVGMLWKSDQPQLPNNFSVASAQFQSLERKLSRNPELRVMYKATVDDDFQKSYVRKQSFLSLRLLSILPLTGTFHIIQ